MTEHSNANGGSPLDVLQARRFFPGLEDRTFLDAACVSLAPQTALDAIADFADMAVRPRARDASEHHILMDQLRADALEQAAAAFAVPPRNLALIESTTYGLNLAAASIPLGPGENVLVADTEFMQVAIPWSKLEGEQGVELREVHSGEDGELTLEDFDRALDECTRAVCVSSVQWCSGYRVDIAGLAELCRARGVWLIVDAIQELGALAVDLEGSGADIVVAGGHKWLNAPFGCGLMYLSDRALEELKPPAWGYLGLEEPAGGWGEYFRTPTITPFRPYSFPAHAKSFETGGTANYPGAIGLAESLKLLRRVGIEAVEAQIRALTDLLRCELERTGARLVSPEAPEHRSAITVFCMFNDPSQDKALLDRLLDEGIWVSMRFTCGVGGIRVSTHYFNNEEDILRLAEAVRRWTPASA